MKIIVLFIAFFCVCMIKTYAQKTLEKDTIYYLVDMGNISLNDRMIEIHYEQPSYKFYTILCPCLTNNQKPIFRCNIKMQNNNFSKDKIQHLKLVSLPFLINKIKETGSAVFNNKHIVYFLESNDNKYIQRQVYFYPPRDPSVDIQVINGDKKY